LKKLLYISLILLFGIVNAQQCPRWVNGKQYPINECVYYDANGTGKNFYSEHNMNRGNPPSSSPWWWDECPTNDANCINQYTDTTITYHDTVTVYDTIPVYDTTFVLDTIDFTDTTIVFDTTFVLDTTIILVPDTFIVLDTNVILDTNIILDTTIILVPDTFDVFDTTFVLDTNIILDTTIILVPDTFDVFDTTIVLDTNIILDTTNIISNDTIITNIFDTTIVNVFDTVGIDTIVTDTIVRNVYEYKNTIIPVTIYDTTVIMEYDTTKVALTVYDTTKIMEYDTTTIPVTVYDTTVITRYDTTQGSLIDTFYVTGYLDVDHHIKQPTYGNLPELVVELNLPDVGEDSEVVISLLADIYDQSGQFVDRIEERVVADEYLNDVFTFQLMKGDDNYARAHNDKIYASGVYILSIGLQVYVDGKVRSSEDILHKAAYIRPN